MFTPRWIRNLVRRVSSVPVKRGNRKRRSGDRPVQQSILLFVEMLEERLAPALLINWNPTVTSGNWNATTSWTGGVIPGPTDTAVFSGAPTGAVTVSLNGNESIAAITFSNTAQSYTIQQTNPGDVLTVGAAGTITASQTAGLTDTISAPVAGAGNLTVTGTTGTLNISGTVAANAAGALLTISNAATTLSLSNTVTATNLTANLTGAGNVTVSGAANVTTNMTESVSSTGSLTVSGATTVGGNLSASLTASTGGITMSNTTTVGGNFSATTSVGTGTESFGPLSVTGTGTETVGSGTVLFGGQFSVTGANTATVSGGTLRLSNFSSVTPNSFGAGSTFTVNTGTLDAFNGQGGSDSLGTAAVTLNGGTFKLEPIPGVYSAAGIFGRYFNVATTNNGVGVPFIDYSGTPATTRSDTGGLNFAANASGFTGVPGVNTTNMAAEWIGGLNVLAGGSYTFSLVSDDGSQLFIDGVSVVNNLGNTTGTGTVVLSAGVHAVEVRFFQGTGTATEQLSYMGPDQPVSAIIPAAADLTQKGLFQFTNAPLNFANNVTIGAGATATIDTSGAVMDATLGTLTTGAGSTLNVTGLFTGRTVTFGSTTLGGNITFNPTSANLALGSVSESTPSALTKTGAGTLTLTGTDTYSGGTNLNAGNLALNNNAAVPVTGTLTQAPATTIVLNAANALGSTINLTAGQTLLVTADNMLNGTTVNVGPGAVLQVANNAGAATSNALNGTTVNLNGGTLSLRSDVAATFTSGATGSINVRDNSSNIDVNRNVTNVTGISQTIDNLTFGNNATVLNVTGGPSAGTDNLVLAGAFTLPSDIVINTVDANFTFAGAVTGNAFKITKAGLQNLNFSVASGTWTGDTGITVDILQGYAASQAAGSMGTGIINLHGGSLALRNASLTNQVQIDPSIGSGTIDLNASLGIGNLLYSSGQVLILTNSAAVNTSVTLTITTTTVGGMVTTNKTLSVASATAGSSGIVTVIFAGTGITGTGTIATLTNTFAGLTNNVNVQFSTTNTTFAGNLIVNAGTITGASSGVTNPLGVGTTITLNGGTLNLTSGNAAVTFNNNLVVNANATVNFQGGSGPINFAGTVTIGNNTLTLFSNNQDPINFNGNWTLTGNATLNYVPAATTNVAVTIAGAIGESGGSFGITKTGIVTGNNVGGSILVLAGTNTYTGETHVNADTLSITGSIKSNSIFVEPGAALRLSAATNLAGSSPSVTMTSSPSALATLDVRYDGALPTIAVGAQSAGSGLIALGSGTYSQNINLATLGDGTFFLGASVSTTLTGTLTIGAGHVYRLGGGTNGTAAQAQLAIGGTNVLADDTAAVSLVIGPTMANGTPLLGVTSNNAPIASTMTGTVVLLNNNTFTGGTTVNRGSSLVISTTASSLTAAPLGTGAVQVYGALIAAGANGSFTKFGDATSNANSSFTFNPGSELRFDNNTNYQGVALGNNNTRWGAGAVTGAIALNGTLLNLIGGAAGTTQAVGNVTFANASSIRVLHAGATTAQLTVTSLQRSGNATLAIVPGTAGTAATGLGVNERIVDTNAATDFSGITTAVNSTSTVGGSGVTATGPSSALPGYFFDSTDNRFVFHGATGFTYTLLSSNTLDTANVGDDVINVGAAIATTGNRSVYGMIVGAFAITGTNTVTVGAGGVATSGTASNTNTLAFGGNEAMFFVASGVTLNEGGTTTGNVTGTNNLTKFGAGNLNFVPGLTTANAITGSYNINTGGIVFRAAPTVVGGNQINLNGNGATFFIRRDVATVFTNNVVVNGDSTISSDRDTATNSTISTSIGNLTIGSSILTISTGNAYLVTATGITTLTGNATINTGSASNTTTLTGAVSESPANSGFSLTKIGAQALQLNAAGSTYTGATNVLGGTLALAAAVTTTSNMLVAPGAILTLNAFANIGAGKTVTVLKNNVALGEISLGFAATQAQLRTILTATSTGVIALGVSNTNALDLSSGAGTGVGDGTFFLGASAAVTYSGATLGVGTGNTYRLGGGGAVLTISTNVVVDLAGPTAGNLMVNAALANGTGTITNGGGSVVFNVAQGYTGTTTLAGAVTFVSTAANDAAAALTQTLTGAVTLMANSTINAGPAAQTYSSIYVLIKGGVNYGGNSLTLGNGVIAFDPTAPAATGTGNTIVATNAVLNVTNVNQLAAGSLQLNSGVYVLGDGVIAPTWAQFLARYSGNYGGGRNQWEITGGNGGFAAKGVPVTIAIDSTAVAGLGTSYGLLDSNTVFDQSFRLGSEERGNLTGAAGSQVYYANAPITIAQNIVLSSIRTITIAATGPGVGGLIGTGVTNRISGNISGTGALRFATNVAPEGLAGLAVNSVAELVLAGTNSWSGNPSGSGAINSSNVQRPVRPRRHLHPGKCDKPSHVPEHDRFVFREHKPVLRRQHHPPLWGPRLRGHDQCADDREGRQRHRHSRQRQLCPALCRYG
jgi:autotransporter-associated beta strand protein